jgi:hypothetical protein
MKKMTLHHCFSLLYPLCQNDASLDRAADILKRPARRLAAEDAATLSPSTGNNGIPPPASIDGFKK